MSFRRRISSLHAYGFLVWTAAISIGSGCSNPSQPGLIPVSGRVTLDGNRLPRGSVSFRPEEGRGGWDQPTGIISPDGQYVMFTNNQPGAPPGRYRVLLFASEAATATNGAAHPGLPKSLVPARYHDPQRTPLRLEVTPSAQPGAYDLELTSHAR